MEKLNELLRGDWCIELEIDYGDPDDLLILDIQMNYHSRLRTPKEFNRIVNEIVKSTFHDPRR